MSVTFKKQLRKNPQMKDDAGKYYPQLIVWGKPATLDTLAVEMTDMSSLSYGDIKSVLTNFVRAMRNELYNGHSVNIEGFGVFGLAATTEGSLTKEECMADKIKSVRITFRASSEIRPSLNSATTRLEDRIEFVDLETQLKRLKMKPGDLPADSGSGDDSGNGGSSGGSGSDGNTDDNPLG